MVRRTQADGLPWIVAGLLLALAANCTLLAGATSATWSPGDDLPPGWTEWSVPLDEDRDLLVGVPPWNEGDEPPWFVLVHTSGRWVPRSTTALRTFLWSWSYVSGPPPPPCHVPGPTPAGRQKGNVPPKVLRKPLRVV